MKIETESVSCPETEYHIKIDDEYFFLTEWELNKLIEGLITGEKDSVKRVGEEVEVDVKVRNSKIEIDIYQGYSNSWFGRIPIIEYNELVHKLMSLSSKNWI